MITSYSISRPNQGRYFISSDMVHKDAERCERKGKALAQRIGHAIANRYNYSGSSNAKQGRLYTAQKGINVITATANVLHERMFKDITIEMIYKAVREKKPLRGWTIKVDRWCDSE